MGLVRARIDNYAKGIRYILVKYYNCTEEDVAWISRRSSDIRKFHKEGKRIHEAIDILIGNKKEVPNDFKS